MWNSSSQCKICFKICDVNEFLNNVSSEKDQSDEDRRKVLNLCSEYLFNELCDWKSICYNAHLPFCVECFQIISQIGMLDEKCKVSKLDIVDFSEQFALKVLRLRNRRDVELFPHIIGGVTIKAEREITCKICHGTYNEKPMCSNESLNLAMVDKIIFTCKKYFFSEIFDDGSLDVHFIAHSNLLPFCSECCISIQDLCQKSDFIDVTSEEIETLVNTFTLKILNYRKNRKYIENSEETAVNVSLLTPDISFRDAETPITTAVEESEELDEDECLIVGVIPTGVQNFNRLKIKKEVMETPPRDTYPEGIPGRQPSTEKISSFNNGFESPCATKFIFPRISEQVSISVPVIGPTGSGNKESTTMQRVSSLGSGKMEEVGSLFSEETPGPSTSRSFSRSKQAANYKCQNCGAMFIRNSQWLKHIDSCFEGSNLFECESCGQCFSDSLYFREHMKSHEVINTNAPPVGIVKATPSTVFEFTKDVNFLMAGDQVAPPQQTSNKHVKSYKCTRCNRSFPRRNHLSNHRKGKLCVPQNRQTSLLAAFSRKRVRTYKKSNSFQKMMNLSNKQPRSFSCRMCSLTFGSQIIFTNHLQTHYDITNPGRRCEICRKVFTTKGNRNSHYAKMHPEKIARDSQRGNYYDVNIPVLEPKVAREEPEKSEEPKKPVKSRRITIYCCPICKVKFNQKSALCKHFDMEHENPESPGEDIEPLNVDDDPGYSLRRPETTSAKQFTCAICRIVFRKIMELRSHLQSHYDEAPYRCTTCRRVLTNQRTLDRHIESVHAGIY